MLQFYQDVNWPVFPEITEALREFDKAYLIKIMSQCLPFIGYPRTLNALRCINEVAAKKEEK